MKDEIIANDPYPLGPSTRTIVATEMKLNRIPNTLIQKFENTKIFSDLIVNPIFT